MKELTETKKLLRKAKEALALEKSISKWHEIVEGTGRDHGSSNCELCQHYKGIKGTCEGCPVTERNTNWNGGCNGTPYTDWVQHHDQAHKSVLAAEGRRVECSKCLEIAAKELHFLKSLKFDGYVQTPTLKKASVGFDYGAYSAGTVHSHPFYTQAD